MVSKAKSIVKYLTNCDYRFIINSNVFHKYDSWSDEIFLKRRYRAAFGKELSLSNPVNFNEKLQWLKLYDRNPLYTQMVDKHLVKSYVANLVGEKYIIPTIGVWNDPDEIDFDKLPNQFALKCNHNSGTGMYICKDKDKLDVEKVSRGLKKGLCEDYYLKSREWPYKDVERKVIAEQYIADGDNGLTDYKVHVFNGVPRFILVCKDRFSDKGLTEDFFTPEWKRLDVKRPNILNSTADIEKPAQLEEILELSKKLSKDIPFVRVDFYIVKNQVFFSELTFYPASGFSAFEPEEWDYTFGTWLKLPNKE